MIKRTDYNQSTYTAVELSTNIQMFKTAPKTHFVLKALTVLFGCHE